MSKEVWGPGRKETAVLTEAGWWGRLAEETAERHLWIPDVDNTGFRLLWEGEAEGGCARESHHSGIAHRRKVNAPILATSSQ